MSDTDNNKTTQRTTGKINPSQLLTLEVNSSGVLMQCPVYRAHQRGRNWFAEIEFDPHSGGLKRRFWKQSRYGGYYVVPNDLPNRLPVPIEIAADYFTTGGNREIKRFYGVIADVQTDGNRITALVVEEYKTALDAIERAREIEAQQMARALNISPHQVEAMQEELHELLRVCRLLPAKEAAVTRLCLSLENALQALDEIQGDADLGEKKT